MEHPLNILERYWNFTSFKPQQEAIIESVLAGEDTFALLPTGGGKSICFQIPVLIKDGICIVISPLVALMKDQVASLKSRGIKAMSITSGINNIELDTLLDNCIYGNYKFLYLSPERLQQEIVQERIKQMNVNLIAVDEAHCISQWGNDFRPAYRNIVVLRKLHPTVNVIALTASATKDVIQDIIKELDFITPKIYKESFYRYNLAYMVFQENDKYYRLEKILKKYKQSSIIYVRNRKLTLELSNFLNSKEITSTYYHGGLTNDEKQNNMSLWLQNVNQVMVATNAFGMGIDKPDVKTVIHINLPESLESYFQEAGRAGRNGEKAFAVILKGNNDDALLENQFLRVLPSVDFIKIMYRKLCNYFQISFGEGQYTSYAFNFNDFCKTYNFDAMLCYNGLLVLDRNSVISLTREFKNKVQVQFIVPTNTLYHYIERQDSLSLIVKSLLRMYGGIYENEVRINTSKVAEKASTTELKVLEALHVLEADNIISLQLSKTDAQITFIEPREDEQTINRISNIITQQNTLKKEQVATMLQYVKNDEVCKSMQLLSYFGEKDIQPCGICSVCIKKDNKLTAKEDLLSVKKHIIELLESSDLSSRQIASKLDCSEKEIIKTLKVLLEHEIIRITESNTYKLNHL